MKTNSKKKISTMWCCNHRNAQKSEVKVLKRGNKTLTSPAMSLNSHPFLPLLLLSKLSLSSPVVIHRDNKKSGKAGGQIPDTVQKTCSFSCFLFFRRHTSCSKEDLENGGFLPCDVLLTTLSGAKFPKPLHTFDQI